MLCLENNKFEVRIDRIILKHNPLNEYYENSRLSDGFIYYLKGGHQFIFNDNALSTKAGDFLYLPYGAEYKNILIDYDTEYYQLDFVFFENNHPIRLFEKPYIFNDDSVSKILKYVYRIYDTYKERKTACNLFCASDIIKIAAILKSERISVSAENEAYDKLRATLDYLEKYYYLDTSVEELASMSFMGISNMEKLFNKYFGMSPTAYRNKLRIEHAAQMLSDGYCSSEAAEKTGFCEVVNTL